MYIYKKTLPLKGWTFGATKYDSHPAGTFSKIFMGGSTFAFYSNSGSSSFRKEYVVDVFDIVKNEAGDKYISVDEFDTATDGFFVKAPIDGGNAEELQGYSAAEIIALGQTIPEANRYANYSALPLATTVTPYTLFGVAASQGSVILFNYKEAGVYYSTGLVWVFSGFPVMEVEPANPNIQAHIASTINPHGVTAAQVGAYTSGQTDILLNGKEDNLAFVTETENKFLRDDNTFQPIEAAVGGYANNLYFAETAIDVVGYETLTYSPEVAETIESWTVNSSDGDKLLKNYLYETSVNTTSIPAGLWSISMFGKVSSSAGVTQMGITYFARHSDNSETDLFTVWSNEINNTIDEWIRFQVTNPSFTVVATDRMGARVKIKTTSGTNKTVTYAVGDGYGAFINNPNKIRHTQLRAHDEDIAVQHIDANTEKETIIDADSLVIWDSVAVKAVRSTFAHIKTTLQSTFAKLTGGNTFTGIQTISQDGNGALNMNASDNTTYSELSWSQFLIKKWGLYASTVGDYFPNSWNVFNYVRNSNALTVDSDNNIYSYAVRFANIASDYLRTNWTLGTGWDVTNVNDTILDKNIAGTGTAQDLNGTAPTINDSYVISFTVGNSIGSGTFNGSFNSSFGGISLPIISAVGLYTFEVMAISTAKMLFSPNSTTRCSISGLVVIPKVQTTGRVYADGAFMISSQIRNQYNQLLAYITPSLEWVIVNSFKVLNSLNVTGTGTFGGNLKTISITDATNATTAALTSSGGLGVAKRSFFGDLMTLLGGINITGVSVFNSSINLPYIAKTADYTLTDLDYTVNCTANTFNVTLPTAVGKQGRIYNIKNTGLGTITVNTTSSETIDGELTQRLVKPTNMQVQSTNANWIIL